MIEVTRGDILKARAEALVNTVNCVGVMGRGIAAQFKRAYPKNFSIYQQACKRHEVQPGQMLIVETGIAAPRWVINFATKRHWRGNSRLKTSTRASALWSRTSIVSASRRSRFLRSDVAWAAWTGPRFALASNRPSPACPA
jgi:O-acetyl-ADP-ribose deacetylase (regulator of RNase III)